MACLACLESPNLHQPCITGYPQLVLKMGVINLDLQGHFGSFDSEFLEIWLVCTITCNGFELESPNLHPICILRFSWLVLNMGVIDHDLQGYLAILSQDSKKWHSALLYWSRPAKGCYMSQCALVSSGHWVTDSPSISRRCPHGLANPTDSADVHYLSPKAAGSTIKTKMELFYPYQ